MTGYEFGSGTDFVSTPSYSNEIRSQFQTLIQSTVQNQETIVMFSDLFRQYDTCKKAYYAYLQDLNTMEDVVYEGKVYPFTEDEKQSYTELSSTIWYNIMDGKYTTEEALAQ